LKAFEQRWRIDTDCDGNDAVILKSETSLSTDVVER